MHIKFLNYKNIAETLIFVILIEYHEFSMSNIYFPSKYTESKNNII